MIKRYYKLVKKYFSLGANNKALLFHLFLSAFLRSVVFLAIPFMASLIVKYVTAGDLRMSLVSVFFFLSVYVTYVLCHHYNYVAYFNNSIFVHNKLQELIMNKVTHYDENFTKNISVAYLINTAFNDVGNVQQIADETFDAITELIGMFIAVIVLSSVSIYIGLITFILSIITISVLGRNMRKRDFYLEKQRIEQDNVAGLMGQVLDGSKEIKSFNMKEDLDKYLEGYKSARKKNYFKLH